MDSLPREETNSLFLKIIIAQAVFVAVVLLGLFAIKMIDGKTFSKVKKWHMEKFTPDTKISEVLDGEKNEI